MATPITALDPVTAYRKGFLSKAQYLKALDDYRRNGLYCKCGNGLPWHDRCPKCGRQVWTD